MGMIEDCRKFSRVRELLGLADTSLFEAEDCTERAQAYVEEAKKQLTELETQYRTLYECAGTLNAR